MSARPPITFLERLNDVAIVAPAHAEALTYNAALLKWENVAVPGGTLATLSDVLIGTPTDGQLLVFAGGNWINYGPLAFGDITGNIAIAQMASGAGADASHYFRGDNTWSAPPVGTIPATGTLLLGDGGGNAMASVFQPFSGGYQIYNNSSGDIVLAVRNNSSGSATVQVGTDLSSELLKLRSWCQLATPGMAIAAANDSAIIAEYGNLILATNGGVIKGSNNNGTSERWRLANGMALGTTVDKGLGTINVSGGFYVNDNKVGGVATVTTTTDQTSAGETTHLTYTVPANTVKVGTTFRISAWGNIDNPTSVITYSPKIKWGGILGTALMATPIITGTTTAQTNRDWELTARVTIRSLGSSGTATAMLHLGNHSASITGQFQSDVATSGATPITVDTTINKDISLTWTMSSPSGTPHVRTFGGVIEIVEP